MIGPLVRPPTGERAGALLQWGSAWAPVAKSLVLFVLPFPLLLAILAAAIALDGSRLAWTSGALACFWSAAALTWRGLAAEARYLLGDRADLPALPAKLSGAVLTAAGAGAAAIAGGQSAVGAGIFAAAGAAGHLCFYGGDLRARRVTVVAVEGVDAGAVQRQLEDAYRRLRRIDAAARAITVPEFCRRLERIIAIGRGILAEIERDPRDATRARRFLNLYLDSTERVTTEYAHTHRQANAQSLEQRFRQLLVDMETSFAEQHRKLLEHDVVSLDVDIEVLHARLKREFEATPLETPR